GGGGSRWWDGSRWTEHQAGPPAQVPAQTQAQVQVKAPAPAPASAAPSPAPSPAPSAPSAAPAAYPAAAGWTPAAPANAGLRRLVVDEQGAARWARWAVLVYAVMSVASLAVWVAHYGGTYHVWDRYIHQVDTAVQHSQSTPAVPSALESPSYQWPLTVLSIAAGVLFLVWQYRAANAARWLRLPARHRPGWGVGFWFIPVANLFCPYQAFRDCLPPNDPGRRRLLRLWWTYLATIVLGLGSLVAAVFSHPAGIVVAAVTAVVWVVVAMEGVKA